VDRTGSWELTFVAGIGLLLFGSIMAFWMRPDEGLDDPAPTIGHRVVPEVAV